MVHGIPVTRTSSNAYGIFVSTAGQALGAPFRLNSVANWAGDTRGVYLPASGRVMIFWKETAATPPTSKLFGASFTLDGAPVGSEFRCAPLDSGVGAYDVSLSGDSPLLAWHSGATRMVSRQFVSALGGTVTQSETVSAAAANPDVPVSVSVSACDSAALIGWLSGSHLASNRRMLLADYYSLEQGASVALNRNAAPGAAHALLPIQSGFACYSLLGRRLFSGGAAAQQPGGVYLLVGPDGRWRRSVLTR